MFNLIVQSLKVEFHFIRKNMKNSTKEIIFKEVNPVHFVTQLGASSEQFQSCLATFLAQRSFNQIINIILLSNCLHISFVQVQSIQSQLDEFWWIINMRNKWENLFLF